MPTSEFFKVHNLGYAQLDLDREKRKGFPEVVFGQGKTTPQLLAIAEKILQHTGRLFITRTDAAVFDLLHKHFPHLKYHPLARCIYYPGKPSDIKRRKVRRGHILVLCAGTTDIPIAEEAALTAKLMGCQVKTIYDVGVAGIHRLLRHKLALRRASVLIVAAGMDAALASVVSGLTDKPIIAVPTSVGYGAAFKGLSALLAMLNACSPGITVVNIDNGFGAGFAAGQILKLAQPIAK
jgi:pyridinium-3,5-biscarboxylic acid mononucleotide synthase